MAVKIRLMRVGKKKQPSYRIVVADSRSPRDGRFIDIIGHYAPRTEPSALSLDEDKALDWIRKGARPTEQVSKLLEVQGIWARYEQELGRPAATKVAVSTTTRRAKGAAADEPAEASGAVGTVAEGDAAASADDGGQDE